jgi:glycosyltransferase involved in cell wall biosynthesis
MLSIIIATFNSEQALLPTLAALVPGATAGLVAEAIVADGGSNDGTATVAEVAGCNFVLADGLLGQRLKAAAAAARAPWLLFLQPGIVLDAAWTAEAGGFVRQTAGQQRAAVFRRGVAAQSALREALSLAIGALGGRPHPEQGLLISRQFYDGLGGHSELVADPEAELLRRIGRRRIATLASRAG